MKRIRLLWFILKRTDAHKILTGFLGFIFLAAFIIWLAEPDITRYRDALWYCYAVISTTGFGDIVVSTFAGKVCSVLLTIYALFVIAIITGVIVNYYNEIVRLRQKETIAHFMQQLENLPKLSDAELNELSQKIKKFK